MILSEEERADLLWILLALAKNYRAYPDRCSGCGLPWADHPGLEPGSEPVCRTFRIEVAHHA